MLIVELLEGQLEVTNAPDFRTEVYPLMQSRSRVVLNMSAVTFVDSAGLHALIGCLQHVHSPQENFRLCCLAPSVLMLFELMDLHRLFSVHPTCPAAVASFQAEGMLSFSPLYADVQSWVKAMRSQRRDLTEQPVNGAIAKLNVTSQGIPRAGCGGHV